MKITNLLFAGLFFIIFAASCGNSENQTAMAALDINEVNVTREAKFQSMDVNFQGKTVTIEAADMIGAAATMNAEDADAQAIMNINQSLMGAEKEAQLLDVNFSMSDEPVENGMFIFGIETENAKNLTLEMFDEEGYAMVANNKFDINEGQNYKALNVESLEEGTYNFRIKDDTGKELNRQVSVATK